MAFAAAEIYLSKNNSSKAIILETAHPVKFPEVVEEAIGEKIAIPNSVQFLLDKQKVSIPLAANYAAFKQWMLG